MADVHSKERRSYNMSRIRSKDTKPEMLVRRFLHSHGYRYRLHRSDLAGKPDLILPKLKTVIFIHGCFWHGHTDCKYYHVPKTETEWWLEKINKNKKRDLENLHSLSNSGWKIIVIWECSLKNPMVQQTLIKLLSDLVILASEFHAAD
ncbi:MAG TPA: DNA mismatch endonuclease Vsr [Mucilaginibacter sp.]|jgi:DNA mismatch endonuclease (patch repair protein)|nr:DNA mismatch endonuclease Vsr [Mucilaginibacter sp.]